jgi:hypothetical protein
MGDRFPSRIINDTPFSYDDIPKLVELYRQVETSAYGQGTNPNEEPTARSVQPRRRTPRSVRSKQDLDRPRDTPDWDLSTEFGRLSEKALNFAWSEAIALTKFHEIDVRYGCESYDFGESWYYSRSVDQALPPSIIYRNCDTLVEICPLLIPQDLKHPISRRLWVHQANQCIQEFGAISTAEDYYQILRALSSDNYTYEDYETSAARKALARVVGVVCRRAELAYLLYNWTPGVDNLRRVVVQQVIKRYQSTFELVCVPRHATNWPSETDSQIARAARANAYESNDDYPFLWSEEGTGIVDTQLIAESLTRLPPEELDEVNTKVILRGDPFDLRFPGRLYGNERYDGQRLNSLYLYYIDRNGIVRNCDGSAFRPRP